MSAVPFHQLHENQQIWLLAKYSLPIGCDSIFVWYFQLDGVIHSCHDLGPSLLLLCFFSRRQRLWYLALLTFLPGFCRNHASSNLHIERLQFSRTSRQSEKFDSRYLNKHMRNKLFYFLMLLFKHYTIWSNISFIFVNNSFTRWKEHSINHHRSGSPLWLCELRAHSPLLRSRIVLQDIRLVTYSIKTTINKNCVLICRYPVLSQWRWQVKL